MKIDAEGVLTNPEVTDLKELQAAWQQGLQKVPADLNQWTDLRFVSLRQLESQNGNFSFRAHTGNPGHERCSDIAGLEYHA